jgi:hypothetical protein
MLRPFDHLLEISNHAEATDTMSQELCDNLDPLIIRYAGTNDNPFVQQRIISYIDKESAGDLKYVDDYNSVSYTLVISNYNNDTLGDEIKEIVRIYDEQIRGEEYSGRCVELRVEYSHPADSMFISPCLLTLRNYEKSEDEISITDHITMATIGGRNYRTPLKINSRYRAHEILELPFWSFLDDYEIDHLNIDSSFLNTGLYNNRTDANTFPDGFPAISNDYSSALYPYQFAALTGDDDQVLKIISFAQKPKVWDQCTQVEAYIYTTDLQGNESGEEIIFEKVYDNNPNIFRDENGREIHYQREGNNFSEGMILVDGYSSTIFLPIDTIE